MSLSDSLSNAVRAPFARLLRRAGAIISLTLLGACHAVVLSPSGDVAAQERDLIVIATVLMLLIIIPVMALTILFARRYREDNTEATYKPDWDHSTALELVIWAAPLLIIICLGAVTWTGTHRLDPYRPIDRIAAGRAYPKGVKPLEVEVVALDWKWLFIYPQYGIATVNELAAPVDRPIAFRITASSVMNSFYIPALAGQVYAMPGMETKLHAVINRPGDFEGFSSNFSGDGFSKMRFRFHGLSDARFGQWVAGNRGAGQALDRARYLELARPSSGVPVIRYASVAPDLYGAILNECVAPGTPCMSDMMRADAATAAGQHQAGAMKGMSGMQMAMPRGPMTAPAAPMHGAGMTPPAAASEETARADRPAPSAL